MTANDMGVELVRPPLACARAGRIEVVLCRTSQARGENTEALRAALAQQGVDAIDAAPSAVAGLLLFEQVDAEQCDALRELARAAHGRTLALQFGAPVPSANDVWRLLHAGAADVLCGGDAAAVARAAAARLQRWREVDVCLAEPLVREHLVGDSPAWRRVLRQLVEVARFSDRNLLVVGESGTGKELAARLLHTLDTRPDKRELVLLDCTTVQPELAGSEFFGHERGAYTGAALARDGAFALADHGTLFLDEVGELPSGLQPQLLRVIQERSYKRLGATPWQRSEFRLVCATHRQLEDDVADGRFRADLYHRIAACRLRMPPLRERREDIVPLAAHFLAEACPDAVPPRLDPAVQAWLQRRDYPGNVRELRQLVARVAARHVGEGPITVGDIPEDDRPAPGVPVEPDWRQEGFDAAIGTALAQGASLREIGAHATAVAIRLALACADGNLQRAARHLGVTDRALQMRRANREQTA